MKYDVFLSFRGDDTRNNFTSHLREALRDKQIATFIDYEQLNGGDEITPYLLSAIEESHISIVIFSKNYASSGLCLQELVKIVECEENSENHKRIVIPVFYEINPFDVKNQTGSYAEAFAQHEQLLMESFDKVQRIQTWKDALKQAANLFGFNSREIKPESVLVNKIVDDVLKKLDKLSPSYNNNLPGMNSRIEEILSLLRRDVGRLGIWGIGGIGKTTLVKEVAKKISCQFESSCFVSNVREYSKQGQLDSLRRSLLSTLLKDKNAYMSTSIEKRLGRKKFLIILDDVTDFKQIEDLIGDLGCLNLESRIIITSRNKQVLKICKVHRIYEVGKLCFNDALKLFCQCGFEQNRPKVDYKELSNSVVKKVGGVPLALKVLGSTLFKKPKEVWESALEKLENSFEIKGIHDALKISYDELDDKDKSIFLDIACFYKGWNIDTVKVIMDACGFSGGIGISNLIDQSLITVSGNTLTMHDLLQEMGKKIVQQESNDPRKGIRLWRHRDIYDALTKAKGTKRTEAISLDMSSSEVRDIKINPHAFKKMKKLRLLNFYVKNGWENSRNKVRVLDELVESNLTELKYLHWYRCPLKSFRKFHFEELVVLEMRNSNIKELWSDSVQTLHNLKRIDLSSSQHLISCPDLSLVPNLESLMLSGCTSLESIPDCTCLKSLKQLIVQGCSKLKRLPQLPPNLEDIGLDDCTSLVEIQSSFTHLHKVRFLILRRLYNLTSIPDLRGLKSLANLVIDYCSKLKMLPVLEIIYLLSI